MVEEAQRRKTKFKKKAPARETARETYRSKPIKDPNRNQAKRLTGGNTGREKGLTESKFGNQSGYSIERSKIKDLRQSVGSLDRRIETALRKGDDATAKDLRSRLNKFTTKLARAQAIQAGGVARSSSGRIMRTSSGAPMLTTAGKEIFDKTKREDFGDPSRKFQNMYPDRYKEMYPGFIHNFFGGIADLYKNMSPMIRMLESGKKKVKESDPYKMGRDVVTIGGRVVDAVTGLPVIKEGIQTGKNIANALTGMIPEDLRNMPGGIKNALLQNVNFPELNFSNIFQPDGIPYHNDIMPGQRYPLDPTSGTYDNKSFADRDVDVFGEVDEGNILGQSSNNTTGQQFDFQPGDSLYSPENYQPSNAVTTGDINAMLGRLDRGRNAPADIQNQSPNLSGYFQGSEFTGFPEGTVMTPQEQAQLGGSSSRMMPNKNFGALDPNLNPEVPFQDQYSNPNIGLNPKVPFLNQNQSPNLNQYFASPEEAINFQDNIITGLSPNNFDSTGLELPPLNQEAIDILNSNATGYNQGGIASLNTDPYYDQLRQTNNFMGGF